MNDTYFRIPFFAMMKKRPQRKTPVAKFDTRFSFSCTSEWTNKAAEAPSAADRFLPVTLAHDWDLVENADEQLETWKSKRAPYSARVRKSSASSPWKLKMKVRTKESAEAGKSRSSPKKDKVRQEKQKKRRRSSAVDSSSEGQSPKKSVMEKSLTEPDKEKALVEPVKEEDSSPKKKKASSCLKLTIVVR